MQSFACVCLTAPFAEWLNNACKRLKIEGRRTAMNIGYIEHVSIIGGAQRMFEILFHGLRETEFAPQVSCPEPGAFVELLRGKGVPVELHALVQPSGFAPLQTMRAFREWSAFIKKNNIALIHANHLHGGRSAILAAAALHIPVICHVHFPLPEDYFHWAFRFLPKPAGVIFCSQELQQDNGAFLSKYIPSARQWVVHNGIIAQNFTPTQAQNAVPRIGIIANLYQRKGHEDFLDMAAILTKNGRNAVYDIIGGDVFDAPRQPHLEAYAAKLGLTERVTFHGQVADVKALLGQLDIMVCASHQEAFPVSILEAMACAKPVVATNVNGIPEAVEDGKTGLLTPPYAPQQLAEAVTKLLDDAPLRLAMGKNGRARVEQYFSCEAYTAATIKAYREVLPRA